MSVNVKFKPVTNENKWQSIKNGDFAIIEGNQENPIPSGLYRIFTTPSQDSVQPAIAIPQQWIIIPIFEGPFDESMFPYFTSELNPPAIKQIINKVHVEVEVNV